MRMSSNLGEFRNTLEGRLAGGVAAFGAGSFRSFSGRDTSFFVNNVLFRKMDVVPGRPLRTCRRVPHSHRSHVLTWDSAKLLTNQCLGECSLRRRPS